MQERQVDKMKAHVQVQKSDHMHAPMGLQKLWWFLLNATSFFFGTYMVVYMMTGWVHERYEIDDGKLYLTPMPITMIYVLIPFTIHLRYRGMPYKLIGSRGKVAVDIIILVSVIMLRIYFPYDGSYFKLALIMLMVSVTLQLHGWGQSLHITWDISIDDVLLHVLMELVTYLIFEDMMCAVLVLFFTCVICYRYFYYSPPSTPESIKKDLGSLPC